MNIDSLENKCFHVNSLSIFSMNIRSLKANIDELLLLLNSINHSFDVIVLSETWLNEDINFLINGYESIHSLCKLNKSDGLSIFVSNICKIKNFRKHIISNCNSIEGNSVFYLTGLYRSPSYILKDFLFSLNDYLSQFSQNVNQIMCGDINIDILSNNIETVDCLNILYSNNFYSACNNPTRISSHSNTCIDHLFLKNVNIKEVSSCVLHSNITDHFSLILSINIDDFNITKTMDSNNLNIFLKN